MAFIPNDPLAILTCISWCRCIVPFITLAFIFTLLILVPQRWLLQNQKHISSQIKLGSVITTINGLKGIVCHLSENCIIIELEDGKKVEITRQAVILFHHD